MNCVSMLAADWLLAMSFSCSSSFLRKDKVSSSNSWVSASLMAAATPFLTISAVRRRLFVPTFSRLAEMPF